MVLCVQLVWTSVSKELLHWVKWQLYLSCCTVPKSSLQGVLREEYKKTAGVQWYWCWCSFRKVSSCSICSVLWQGALQLDRAGCESCFLLVLSLQIAGSVWSHSCIGNQGTMFLIHHLLCDSWLCVTPALIYIRWESVLWSLLQWVLSRAYKIHSANRHLSPWCRQRRGSCDIKSWNERRRT